MQGALGKIFSSLSSNYGDDVARNIVGNYGDDVIKKGMNSFLGRTVSGQADDVATMVAYHGIPADKLKLAATQMDNHLVNPSIQSVNPAKNMGGDFGEIVLLGNKDLVNPMNNNVQSFNRDVYTPRFPSIDDEGMIASTNKLATPNSVSEYMNKAGMRGAEEIFNNMELAPGVIAAKNAKRFKGLRDMVESQGNIQQYPQVKSGIQSYENNLFDLVDEIYNRNMERGVDWDTVVSDANSILNNKRISPTIGADDIQQLNELKKGIGKLPTDYFETKITRPVKLNEFTGAILPDDMVDPDILNILEQNNIPIVKRYDQTARINNGDQNASLQKALTELSKQDRFTTPYLLGTAGLIPTAGILGSLLMGGQSDQQQMV